MRYWTACIVALSLPFTFQLHSQAFAQVSVADRELIENIVAMIRKLRPKTWPEQESLCQALDLTSSSKCEMYVIGYGLNEANVIMDGFGHSFAIYPAPGEKDFRLVLSKANATGAEAWLVSRDGTLLKAAKRLGPSTAGPMLAVPVQPMKSDFKNELAWWRAQLPYVLEGKNL